jgi:hypothetical protein
MGLKLKSLFRAKRTNEWGLVLMIDLIIEKLAEFLAGISQVLPRVYDGSERRG